MHLSGLICYGSPDLYDYTETSSIIWNTIQVEAKQSEKVIRRKIHVSSMCVIINISNCITPKSGDQEE